MLNRISRRTYGLACLAIFVAIVLAGCPAAITKPTVAKKLADIASLAVGEPQTVDIRGVFKGEKLDYSVRSSAPTIASAQLAENNQSVTIVAVRAGTATITVTAKNDGGSASRSFEVITVPSPTTQSPPSEPPPSEPPPPEPPPPPDDTSTDRDLTIRRGESVEYKLPAGQSLKAPKGDVVSVQPKGGTDNVWVIRAHKKGTHAITIFEGTEAKGHIVVTVPNSRPVRVHTYDHDDSDAEGSPEIEVPNPLRDQVEEKTPDAAGRFKVGFTDASGLRFKSFFSDDDMDDFRYRVANQLPSWILLDSKDGFVIIDTDDTMLFEVLERQIERDRKFTVALHAVDDSGDESLIPLVIEVVAPAAAAAVQSTYEVVQGLNGDLNRDGTLRIGPRMVGINEADPATDRVHTLKFLRASTDHPGFRFASLKAAALVKAGDLFFDSSGANTIENQITASASEGHFNDGDTIPQWTLECTDVDDTIPKGCTADGTNVNSDYYLLKASGNVEAEWHADENLNGDPQIQFKLKKRTGSGKITIEYHVWKYTGSEKLEDATTIKGSAPDRATESISLDIVTCSSPPDRLSACPGSGIDD